MLKWIGIIIPLVILLTNSCTSLKFYPVKQKIEDPRTQAEKEFNPLGFEEDKKILTQREYQGKSEASEEEGESQVYVKPDSSRESEEQYKTVYRVQVYVSKTPGEAASFADSIKSIVDSEKVYIEYQSPYYRVRIGNFSGFDEAEVLMDKLKKMGFRDAWVVKTRVKIEDEGNQI
ncbi:MAG: SPOR domain-containing protein [candidate division Zixibacteria bacterium]|nr:SPOR domain-containing protein [candidate division Zixibacteria bacterium]